MTGLQWTYSITLATAPNPLNGMPFSRALSWASSAKPGL
jgi:hypothetical protein